MKTKRKLNTRKAQVEQLTNHFVKILDGLTTPSTDELTFADMWACFGVAVADSFGSMLLTKTESFEAIKKVYDQTHPRAQ
jgi:hypothetical protein